MPESFSRASVPGRALARIGTIVQQKYRIDRLVGVGGMAVVYAATHRNGHRVAIKFLLEHYLHDADMLRLFRREAYVANQIGHPGAVPVLDDDADEDGCAFLIMPLLEGESLRSIWERSGRRMPLEVVLVLMSDALDVLAAAHARGIVHRDIKPDNLFVTGDGALRVLDFGIARRIQGDGSVTLTGPMIGTPAFMPPEQALGERDAIGPQSDCWAVSATIFALVSGEYVHRTDSAGAQLAAAATRHARSISEAAASLPAEIVRFVNKGLAFDPKERWGSAREMRDALREVTSAELKEPFEAIEARVRARLTEEMAPKSADPSTNKTAPPFSRKQSDTAGGSAGWMASKPAARGLAGAKRRRRWYYAVGGAAALLAGALVVPWLGMRRHATVSGNEAPLADPSSVIACPILEAAGVPEPAGWLGAAAAGTICERARVMLGGEASRTLVPAELLALPMQPVDHFPKDPYGAPDARARSLDAARSRAAAYVDGRVTKEPAGFRTTLVLRRPDGTEIAHAEGRGRALYEAVRQAMEPLVGPEKIAKVKELTPTVAEWSRVKDVDSGLALLDVTLAQVQNAGTLPEECTKFAARGSAVAEVALHEAWICAYTIGAPTPAVKLTSIDVDASVGTIAARARLQDNALQETDADIAARLQDEFERERTPVGRSVLASTLSCILQTSAPDKAANFARLAVQSDPKNALGEFCAPWGQFMAISRDTASSIHVIDAMQAWEPWNADAWIANAMRREDFQQASDYARRAYTLAPFNVNVAGLLADQLLEKGAREEVRSMAIAMGADEHAVQRAESDLLLVRVDASEARFGAALARAKRAMTVHTDDAGWVLEQRLEIAWLALEVADILGRGSEIADVIANDFLKFEASSVPGSYVNAALRIPSICLRASSEISKRCFAKFRALRSHFTGMLPETDTFTTGAECYARGDLPGAARSWKPFLREPGMFTKVVSDAMEATFERSGDQELVARLEAIALGEDQYNGANLAFVRAARRAAARRDFARARELARKVIEAWSTADEPVPVVADMRKLLAPSR